VVATANSGVYVDWIFDARHYEDKPVFANEERIWIKILGERNPVCARVLDRSYIRSAKLEPQIVVVLDRDATTMKQSVFLESQGMKLSEYTPVNNEPAAAPVLAAAPSRQPAGAPTAQPETKRPQAAPAPSPPQKSPRPSPRGNSGGGGGSGSGSRTPASPRSRGAESGHSTAVGSPSAARSSTEKFVQELMQWSERNNSTGSDDKIERLRSLFVINGTTRDSMDVIEFSEALLQLGISYTTDTLLSLLATFDDDGNGKLQFDELASFLRDDDPGKYDFGDIWERMRAALVHEENGHKVHRIGDFDEKIMEASATDNASAGSGIITSEQFVNILEEFHVTPTALNSSDITKLKDRFEFQRTGNEVSLINGSKLCAWLQPVNVDRAAKRISKALDSYSQRKQVDRSSIVTSILAKLAEMALASGAEGGEVAGVDFSEVLHEYSVAVSRAEVRAFSAHFGHKNTGKLTREQCKALLNGSATVNAPVITRLPSSGTAILNLTCYYSI
jgi:hypothetical protein